MWGASNCSAGLSLSPRAASPHSAGVAAPQRERLSPHQPTPSMRTAGLQAYPADTTPSRLTGPGLGLRLHV